MEKVSYDNLPAMVSHLLEEVETLKTMVRSIQPATALP